MSSSQPASSAISSAEMPVSTVSRWLSTAVPSLSLWDFYTFLLASACFISFNVGGTLFGSDLLLALGFPILITTRFHALFYKPVRWVLIFAVLWLLSQMVTDFVRGVAPEDFARGWLKIIFTIAHFCVIWILIHGSRRRCMLYAVGLALGTFARALVLPNGYVVDNPWKFGYAFPLSIIVLLIVCFLIDRKYSIYYLLPAAALAAVNVYEDYRSEALILIVTLIVTHSYKSLRAKGKTLSKRKLLGLGVAVVLSAACINLVYAYAASHYWLGAATHKKFVEQAGGMGGVLLGGRSELFSSTAAIADSPWIGHGSWAKDPKYMWIMVKRMREFGYYRARIDRETQEAAENGVIPTHSHILGSWVEAGILGAVFWGYILYLLARFLFTLTGNEPFLPFALFMVSTLMWDIVFSPYGAERRFTTTYFIAFLLAIVLQRERQQAIKVAASRPVQNSEFGVPVGVS